MENFTAVMQNMPVKRRILLGLSTGLLVLVIGFFVRAALAPSYKLLYAGLESGSAGHVIAALDQRGILYQIRNGSIFVDQKQRDELRMTLASIGLPKASTQGYELLDNLSGFSTTSQMFDAAYWRAKEGELARTIAASPLINSARVHIANPSTKFIGQHRKTKASVSIRSTNGGINLQQAKAFKYLVSSAVSGLAVSAVAIIDEDLGLIADSETKNTTPLADEQAARIKLKVEHLLAAHLGFGNAIAEVSLETFQNSESIIEKRFDPKSRVAISVNSVETESTSKAADDQSVGVASNLPDTSGQALNSSHTATTETRETTNYEVSETQRELTKSPHRIARMTVAVLVNRQAIDASSPEQTVDILDDIRELVESTAGFQNNRGDVITVKALDFKPRTAEPKIPNTTRLFIPDVDVTALLKVMVLAAIALILGLRIIRPMVLSTLKTADANLISGPIKGSSQQQDTRNQVEFEGREPLTALINAGAKTREVSGTHDTVHRLRDMIGDKQEETVEILRNWLEEGRKTP